MLLLCERSKMLAVIDWTPNSNNYAACGIIIIIMPSKHTQYSKITHNQLIYRTWNNTRDLTAYNNYGLLNRLLFPRPARSAPTNLNFRFFGARVFLFVAWRFGVFYCLKKQKKCSCTLTERIWSGRETGTHDLSYSSSLSQAHRIRGEIIVLTLAIWRSFFHHFFPRSLTRRLFFSWVESKASSFFSFYFVISKSFFSQRNSVYWTLSNAESMHLVRWPPAVLKIN